MGSTIREQLIGSRFAYVKYDDAAIRLQEAAKELSEALEGLIEDEIESPRAKALALTKLEEVYMWVGKGIRDDQIKRNKSTELQEERKDDSKVTYIPKEGE